MTAEERNEIIKQINKTTVEPTEPMTLEDIKMFVKGYELAIISALDAVDRCYRNMKSD